MVEVKPYSDDCSKHDDEIGVIKPPVCFNTKPATFTQAAASYYGEQQTGYSTVTGFDTMHIAFPSNDLVRSADFRDKCERATQKGLSAVMHFLNNTIAGQ